MAADRRCLATAPARAQHGAGASRQLVPIRRVRNRDLDRVHGRRHGCIRLVRAAAHRFGFSGRGRSGADHEQSKRAVSPEHADDRAAAVRHLAARCGADGGLGRSRRSTAGPRTGICHRCRMHDALRSVASLRRAHRARSRRPVATQQWPLEHGSSSCAPLGLSRRSHRLVPIEQPLDCGLVVRQQWLLRGRKRNTGHADDRVGPGA